MAAASGGAAGTGGPTAESAITQPPATRNERRVASDMVEGLPGLEPAGGEGRVDSGQSGEEHDRGYRAHEARGFEGGVEHVAARHPGERGDLHGDAGRREIGDHGSSGEGAPDRRDDPEREALEDEEAHHARAAHAESAHRPDLARPLAHAHEHGVHHPDAGRREQEAGEHHERRLVGLDDGPGEAAGLGMALDPDARALREGLRVDRRDRRRDRRPGAGDGAGRPVLEEHLDVRGPARPVDERLGGLQGHVEGVVVPRRALVEDAADRRVQAVDRPLRSLDDEGHLVPDPDAELAGRGLGHVDCQRVVLGQEDPFRRRLRGAQLGLPPGHDPDDPGDARPRPGHGRPAHEEVRHGAGDGGAATRLLDPPRERGRLGQAVLTVGVEGVVLRLEVVGADHHLQVAGLDRDEVVRELAGDAVGEPRGEDERGGAQRHAAPGERVPPLGAEQVAEGDGEEAQGHGYTCRSASAGRIRAAMTAGPSEASTETTTIITGTETRSAQARAG